jgi:hypothetical protein
MLASTDPDSSPVALVPPAAGEVVLQEAPTPDSSTAELPAEANARVQWIEQHRELLGWGLALLITVGVAGWIYWLQLAFPIPPGSDPGNWVSISYAYIGGHYAGQVNPYGYPPLLFPILGSLVLLTGSPLAAGHLIIPIEITLLGLSTYALSRVIIRSVVLSLGLVTFLLLDPYFMTMFFWGALPNLLAFSFLNLSLVGLVWMGAGRLNRGTLFFWGFGAATVLTHALAGLALAAIVVAVLFLSMFVPLKLPKSGALKAIGDAPSLLLRRLVFSRPGFYGFLAAGLVIGGWYLGTILSGTPHPGYFTPGSAMQMHPATYGQFLRNLLPGLVLSKYTVFYLLIFLVAFLFAVFGGLVAFRSGWISTGLLVLLGSWLAIAGIAIVGWLLSISTDYHRFGFFLVIPAGLTIAFLIDRLWLARGPTGSQGSLLAPPPEAGPEVRPIPPTFRPTRRARVAFVGVFVLVVGLIAAGAAAPTYTRYVNVNAGPTHDQLFVDALNAIDHSGVSGSILTIKGNLKWTWAITQRAAYAPRPGNAFLFYPIQITDSALAYYALTSREAVTNGLVSVSVAGTNPAYLDGIPDFSVYQTGGVAGTMRLPPQLIQVTLMGATNHTDYTVGLSGSPTYQAPAGPGLPAVITYTEPSFLFQQSISIQPGVPTAHIATQATATRADRIVSLQEVLTGPALVGVTTQLTAIPGTFQWQTYTLRYTGLLTDGLVTPASALQGVTDYYPAAGGGAAVLDFTPSGGSPAATVNGSLDLNTPSASGNIPNLPSTVNTTQVWHQLGVRFIVIPNQASFALYAGSFLLDESEYLVGEFGCQVYYSNAEWDVLIVPQSVSGPALG